MPDRPAPVATELPLAGHERALAENGWTLLPPIVPAAMVTRLSDALGRAYVEQRALQISNGVDDGADGTVHHLPCAGGVFLELLEQGRTYGKVVVRPR